MIYLYCGDDTYSSFGEALKKVEYLSQTKNLDSKILNVDDLSDIKQFTNNVESIDMFSNGSVIFAKRLFENKQILSFITDNFESFDSYEIVIWLDKKADSRLNFVKKLLNLGRVNNFEIGKQNDIRLWLSKYLKQKEIQLSTKQIDYVISRTEFDKGILSNEVEKIELFLNVKNSKTIEDHQLESLLGLDAKGDIWKFLDYFGSRNFKKTIDEFAKLAKFEENGQYIIAMLERELRLIYQLKYCQENNINSSVLKLNPYVVEKAKQKAKNFSNSEINEFLQKLLEADSNIKSGDVLEEEAIVIFLTNL